MSLSYQPSSLISTPSCSPPAALWSSAFRLVTLTSEASCAIIWSVRVSDSCLLLLLCCSWFLRSDSEKRKVKTGEIKGRRKPTTARRRRAFVFLHIYSNAGMCAHKYKKKRVPPNTCWHAVHDSMMIRCVNSQLVCSATGKGCCMHAVGSVQVNKL